jgi:phosphatidylglycerol---prolipoprotein diacylglyceryl transferase
MYPELFKIPWLNYPIPSYGVMVVIALLGAVWWMTRIAKRVKADPDIVLNMGFLVLIFNVIGARAFYVIHYWDQQFAHQPWRNIIDLRSGGFEFYGGFIGAFTACFLYLLIKRVSIRLYADLATPPLLMGMGIGRIGCFLFGCCWGAVCPPSLPWAVEFPCSSPPHQSQWEHRQVTVPAELLIVDGIGRGASMPREVFNLTPKRLERMRKAPEKLAARLTKAKTRGDQDEIELAAYRLARVRVWVGPLLKHFKQFDVDQQDLEEMAADPRYRSRPVHPAQLYSAVGPLLLAWVAYAFFNRRKRHGTVMILGVGLYAVERFIEEIIRADNPTDTFGLTASQGVSIVILSVVLLWYLCLRRLPPRSPRAVPVGPKD